MINGPTRIGADNRIFQFASIGDAPQDKKYKGEPTRLEIGDRNVFREFCTMNRGHGARRRASPASAATTCSWRIRTWRTTATWAARS